MDVTEVLGSSAAQAMGFQLFAPIDHTVILSNGGSVAQGTFLMFVHYILCMYILQIVPTISILLYFRLSEVEA